MERKSEYTNPIRSLRLHSPDFVWEWYEFLFRQAVREHTRGEANSEYKSMMITFARYRDGVNGQQPMLRLNIYLRRIMERVFPISKPDAFFIGSERESELEALATAGRMKQAYEKEYERQSKQQHVPA